MQKHGYFLCFRTGNICIVPLSHTQPWKPVYLNKIGHSGNTPGWVWNYYCKEFIGAIRMLKCDLSHPYPCLARTPNECNMQCVCTMWCSKWRSGWIKGIGLVWFQDACPIGSTRCLVLITLFRLWDYCCGQRMLGLPRKQNSPSSVELNRPWWFCMRLLQIQQMG